MTSKLFSFLAPKTIAVVGASKDPSKRGYQAIARLLNDDFDGLIYPVNPREPEILGLRAYAHVSALPGDVDLAFICTPASSLPAVLADCARKHARGAIVLAAGFSEAGEPGRALEARAMAIARKHGIRVIGPNTNGVLNMHRRMNLVGLSDVERGSIGVVSQSGNVMLALAAEAKRKGAVGFSTYIGVGNQADVEFHEYLLHLSEDPDTAVPVFYVEGFKAGRAFLDAAAKVTPSKPVVVYKSGRTESGKRSASSHTGSLAAGFNLTRDLLRQSGVIVVSESDKILSVAEALARMPLPRGSRVGVLADSGGHGTIMADALEDAGMSLAELSAGTVAELRSILPSAASILNPIDVAGATDNDPGVFASCARALLADENVSILVIAGMFGGYAARFTQSFLDVEVETSRAISALARTYDKPVLVQSVYMPLKPAPLMELLKGTIPVFIWAETAATCVAELVRLAQARARLAKGPRRILLQQQSSAAAIIACAQDEGREALLEPESRELLVAYGIDVPSHYLMQSSEDADAAVFSLAAPSFAMKIVSPDVLHKSEAGGVELRVRGVDGVRKGYEAIVGRVRSDYSEARIEGVMVAPMAKPGVEVIIGVIRDPVFGPVIMFGIGGVFVEILKDVSFRAIPVNRDDVVEMIDQIEGNAILNGARGMPPVDREALIDLLLAVSDVIQLHQEIRELDLNPVILHDRGYTIVDSRIIVGKDGCD
ncbi:acetate--CoA ligase family protein [Bradyrhizobium sp. 180]|uniref:acetate--CoA ligase family protein n=1 Tax=Bradyrhizobium sp. 180 TaxID=2782650 RepID=UPI001FF824FD|nr:acetate--CoA ligase [Bradyrhizobium sp. 180]MCK1493567.1 acetate--CoA ligase family protein [Bradyrhizobium sp. 180]